MRMRKLPWAEEYLQDAEVVIKDPSQLKGRWRTLVHGEKLHLEIGCGKGDYWNQMAKRYPQDGWIAIEKNVSVAWHRRAQVRSAGRRSFPYAFYLGRCTVAGGVV